MDWEAGSHASTFGGNPLACAAASKVIDVIRDQNLLDNANKQGKYILKWFEDLKKEKEIIGDVRGKGLMIGVEFVTDKDSKNVGTDQAKDVMLKCWKRGVAVVTCGVSTLRLVPPLTITRELVDTSLEILEDVIKEVNEKFSI